MFDGEEWRLEPPGVRKLRMPLREDDRGSSRFPVRHAHRARAGRCRSKREHCPGKVGETGPSCGLRLCTGPLAPQLHPRSRQSCQWASARSFDWDSSPGGTMRQQTTSFIVEIKQSRNPKSGTRKTSIWGKLDLRASDDLLETTRTGQEAAAPAKVGEQR